MTSAAAQRHSDRLNTSNRPRVIGGVQDWMRLGCAYEPAVSARLKVGDLALWRPNMIKRTSDARAGRDALALAFYVWEGEHWE